MSKYYPMRDAKIACDLADYGNQVSFAVVRLAEDGTHEALLESDDGAFRFQKPEDLSWGDPLLILRKRDAIKLLDAMWELGLRPSEHKSPGELAATNRHLEDMRNMNQQLLAEVLRK